jgi:hypothetical protein
MVTVAALTHPSHRHINVKQRRYKGVDGEGAEDELIQDAINGMPI